MVAGELIPGDGDIIWGIASVDESAITGESAPVVRESGGDRSAVTGGTRVLSDRIVVKITSKPGETFVDRMIALVEGASRQKTPNEIALNILLASLTIIFVVVVLVLGPIAGFANAAPSVTVLVALLVCLIPTTIGALLSAIGIAGMDRLVQHNVLAMSGRAVEAAGDVTTLLLDKTGTITYGNRQASELVPVADVDQADLIERRARSPRSATRPRKARRSSTLADHARIRQARECRGRRRPLHGADPHERHRLHGRLVHPQGAPASVIAWVERADARFPRRRAPTSTARSTASPRSVEPRWPSPRSRRKRQGARVLGVIYLKDIVKTGLRERFADLRAMGIRTVMITGDNPRHRRRHREGSRRRRLPGRGHAGRQAGPDQEGAGGRPPRRHDRRRNERRSGSRASGCRRRDEHGNLGREGGRQHGRPRLRPDQAHRHRHHRQAAAHHPRRADDVLDRQ